MNQEERENQLILSLCAEVGEVGADDELIEGFRGNHAAQLIADAANGDVVSLVVLRTAAGLPFTC